MPEPSTAPIVVVSNRGPLQPNAQAGRRGWARSAGGLVTALDPLLRKRGGTWVSSIDGDGPADDDVALAELGYELGHVRLPRSVATGFYQKVSNAVIWPLLHGLPATIRPGGAPFRDYVAANQAFADAVLAHTTDDAPMWIQDYHPMMVPHLVRHQRPNARIGWFGHVPWPPTDIFQVLPWRRPLLEGLLAADLLGFQTHNDALNFLACPGRLLESEVDLGARTIRFHGRTSTIVAAPIGIPFDEFSTVYLPTIGPPTWPLSRRCATA